MKRIKLFIPPVVLAVITMMRLFCREGRWYDFLNANKEMHSEIMRSA